MLVYECCLSPAMLNSLRFLFDEIIQFVLKSETDLKMGELLRVLLPIISLYQEGKKMDEKPIRNSQKELLAILMKHANTRLHNSIYALIQRLVINTPDRVDDRKNTVDIITQIALSLNQERRERVTQWLVVCARCNIANIRLGAISVMRELLMTKYVSDAARYQEQMEEEEEERRREEERLQAMQSTQENGEGAMELEIDISSTDGQEEQQQQQQQQQIKKKKKRSGDEEDYDNDDDDDDDYDNENGEERKQQLPVRRQLFIESEPLVPLFLGTIVGRCNDIVISIRAEAVHVCVIVNDDSQ